jgi:hypothetical protein
MSWPADDVAMRAARSFGSALVLAAALSGSTAPGRPDNVPASVNHVSQTLPATWRWESYGRLDLGVPGDWGYGTAGRQWCGQRLGETPFVGRPGSLRMFGCAAKPGSQNPDTALSTGGEFVWFQEPLGGSDRDGVGTVDAPIRDGDRETFVETGVQVAIQAPPVLRARILATLRVADQDHNGCPADSPLANDPGWRPAGPAVTTLTGVTEVSACAYSQGNLASSQRIHGAPAVTAIAAVAAAPVGAGPNSPPSDCSLDEPATEDMILLKVASASGESRIVVRYGGCFHRGLDDGITPRRLTRAAVAPFITGPNRVTSFYGTELRAILTP